MRKWFVSFFILIGILFAFNPSSVFAADAVSIPQLPSAVGTNHYMIWRYKGDGAGPVVVNGVNYYYYLGYWSGSTVITAATNTSMVDIRITSGTLGSAFYSMTADGWMLTSSARFSNGSAFVDPGSSISYGHFYPGTYPTSLMVTVPDVIHSDVPVTDDTSPSTIYVSGDPDRLPVATNSNTQLESDVSGISAVLNGIWDFFCSFWDMLRGFFQMLYDGLTGTLNGIVTAISNGFTAIGDLLRGIGNFFVSLTDPNWWISLVYPVGETYQPIYNDMPDVEGYTVVGNVSTNTNALTMQNPESSSIIGGETTVSPMSDVSTGDLTLGSSSTTENNIGGYIGSFFDYWFAVTEIKVGLVQAIDGVNLVKQSIPSASGDKPKVFLQYRDLYGVEGSDSTIPSYFGEDAPTGFNILNISTPLDTAVTWAKTMISALLYLLLVFYNYRMVMSLLRGPNIVASGFDAMAAIESSYSWQHGKQGSLDKLYHNMFSSSDKKKK